ncbi:galactosyl transferase [Thioalkalivibrio sp. ALJ16]|uniref:galactosyl transferase n=1 Tax=Thioalkalivibrio sp. ALJ16 TaxID=1158762 RepID=UPI0012DCB5D6|nr:galactosyl transferase [Thioalkalivibrio sp. ALJ16]
MAKLNFIVPIRHPDNVRDKTAQWRMLSETIASIAAQDGQGWQAIIVANNGVVLPPLPDGVVAKRVDFPKNDHHERGARDNEAFWDAVRLDKGRRVAAALESINNDDFVMVVDDDDFISRRLAAFVAERTPDSGWYINQGYKWRTGARMLFKTNRFHVVCGTSLIVRAGCFNYKARNESVDAIRELGSHHLIRERLRDEGRPLSPIPFAGAVYRIGHRNAHSSTRDPLAPKRKLRARMRSYWRKLTIPRPLTTRMRREFFGGNHPLAGTGISNGPRS